MSDHEFEHEPVAGLPEQLPVGEVILWQGAPEWRSLAVHAFRMRGLSLYFLALIAWRAHATWTGALLDSVAALTPVLLLSTAGLGLLATLGWLMARSTLYTITNRRVVIRAGVAIPITINIPFKVIESAAVRSRTDGTGDLPLQLNSRSQVSYVVMWPHVRPWSIGQTQPMLRAIREPHAVAGILADALAQSLGLAPVNEARQIRVGESTGRAVGGLTTAARLTGTRMSESHSHNVVLPRAAIIGAGALVMLTIFAAAMVRFTGNVATSRPDSIATVERQLRFDDRDDGAVIVHDMHSSEQIATLAPGTNGFIRGVLRGLVRDRRSRDIGADRPFVLTRWSDGHLTVTDSATGRRIELRAFGPTNEQAFMPLLAGAAKAELRTAARE